jgi:hypothetical protein
MVMLGCDVYILGMKAIRGKSSIRIVLSEDRTCEDGLFASLEKQFMESNNICQRKKYTHTLTQSYHVQAHKSYAGYG